MKKLVLIALLVSSPSFAAEKPTAPCDLSNPQSVCTVTLTVEQWKTLAQVLDEAPVPHRTWGATWQEIITQLQAQQKQPAQH